MQPLLEQPEIQLLADLIHRCMDRNIGDRPQSADDLSADDLSADDLYAQLLDLQDRFRWTRNEATPWWDRYGQDLPKH